MQDLAVIWLSLLACLAVIGVAGVRLSRYGDIIAEKSGLSRGWVGLILLATVTADSPVTSSGSEVTEASRIRPTQPRLSPLFSAMISP